MEMDQSLDERIRNNHVSTMDMSLDEIIYMNKIGKQSNNGGSGGSGGNYGNRNQNNANGSGPSKFERYRRQDNDDDDEIEEEMPKLVPTTIKTMLMKNTKPIHERLGVRGSSERGSICESVHTSQMNILHPTISKAKNRRSVQDRLSKAWVNPATKERNRIALHALETMVNDKSHNMLIESDKDATELLTAFAQAIKRAKQPAIESADQKYDMKLQKEISMLQGKPVRFTCPGGFVVSSNGPGIGGRVSSHATDMSMNQRFA